MNPELDDLRSAVDEHERAVDAVWELARARGQSDEAIPLIVLEGDAELVAAVQRELDARSTVASVVRQRYRH